MKTESTSVFHKLLVLEKIFMHASMIFACTAMLLVIFNRELLLGNIVINDKVLSRFMLICSTIYSTLIRRRRCLSEKHKMSKARVITTVIVVLLGIWLITSDVEGTIAKGELSLSDGKKVLMIEKYFEDRYNDKYIEVYQKGFLTCVKLGEIDECYYFNTCLLQNKYSYDYNVQNKLLTVHCEYGIWREKGALPPKNDTGIISTEFQLK